MVLAGFARIAQPNWARWRKRMNMEQSLPGEFAEVLAEVIAFADPVLTWQADGLHWRAATRQWQSDTTQ